MEQGKPSLAWRYTLDEYLEYCAVVQGLAPLSVDSYRRDLNDLALFLSNRGAAAATEPSTLQREDIRAYLEYLRQQQRKPSTLSRRLSAIHGLCKYLVREKVLSHDPSHGLLAPPMRRPFPHALTEAEMNRLLAAAELDTPRSRRDRALLELGYGCGLRVTELISLTLYDIDRQQALIRVFGKGSQERIVPVGAFALVALERYLQVRDQLLGQADTQELFLNHRGGKLSRSGFWRILAGYGQRLDLPVHPHTLRHSAATHMLANGADLRVIQEFLGHRDISTTQIYAKLENSELKGVYQRCHPRA